MGNTMENKWEINLENDLIKMMGKIDNFRANSELQWDIE